MDLTAVSTIGITAGVIIVGAGGLTVTIASPTVEPARESAMREQLLRKRQSAAGLDQILQYIIS